MPDTPHFDRIVATITDSDIAKFLRSAAPDDEKQRVHDAASTEIKMRLVGGYLIRTNQIKPPTLNPTGVKNPPIRARKRTNATTT